MLKKIFRLDAPKLIRSKNIQSASFSLKTAKNDLDIPRFAFVISKKLDKRAVVRNSTKRKLSSCIEEIFDRIKGGNDFIFYPKPLIVEMNHKELLSEIENVFRKEGLQK
jgi:ribonuclease P protein component